MMDWQALIDQMASGSIPALSRLITFVENRAPGWRSVMKTIYPLANKATIIGITGYPGAGKSTLTGQMAMELSNRGKRVGIIAIDPSSHLTGGAFLGDRVRMNDLSAVEGVFMRSMGSRGSIGGIHPAARDVIRILNAFGKDYILVETIGVGQDEIDITRTAHIVVLVCAPGQGDAIQYLKAGILESADIYVANKSDLPEAEQLVSNLQGMLMLEDGGRHEIRPIVKTIATQKAGIAKLVDEVEKLAGNAQLRYSVRRQMAIEDIKSGLKESIAELAERQWDDPVQLSDAVDALLAGHTDPYTLADEMITKCLQQKK